MQIVQKGKPAEDPTLPADFTKTNYEFGFWSENAQGKTKYTFETPVEKDITLYAVWVQQKNIHDIQGKSHTSPLKDEWVKSSGVVTALTYSKGTPNGFYMQNKDTDKDSDNATSEGIYVYCGSIPVPEVLKTKDLVTVTGYVKEHTPAADALSITQITVISTDAIKVTASDITLPEPVELIDTNLSKDVFKDNLDSLDINQEAIDYYESLEGMRVKVTQPKVAAAPYKATHYIAPQSAAGYSSRGGMMYNSYKNTALICMYANGTCFANPADLKLDKTAALGDSYTSDIIGVLSSYFNYQIVPTEPLPTLTKGSITPESSTINADENKLSIVSYNLENFSKGNTKKSQSSGKLAEERAEGFAKHLVTDMKAPDVICLIEIQDDSGDKNDKVVTSQETLQLLIDKIKALNSSLDYKPVWIDPENNKDGGKKGANIRCAYLYNTARIALMNDADSTPTLPTASGTKAVIESGGSKLADNPARIGIDSDAFNGTRKSLVAHFKLTAGAMSNKDFFVINNHLSSKRGDGKIWGATQPVVRGSETNRHKQAAAVVDFIKTITTARSDAAVISVGDYNDFWFSETVKKFTAAGMKNVIEKLPENERYTYVYDGHSQTLDNILVTSNITIHNPDVLHVNSELSEKERLSDHDPVFVQLSW